MKLRNILSAPKKIYHAITYAYSEYEHATSAYSHPKDRFAHFGENTVVQPKVFISHCKRLYLGDNCTVQSRVSIHSMGGVHIGNYVGVGFGSVIMSFVHNYNYCKSIPYDNTILMKPVVIRDYVWLSWHCLINPGVEIGEGAIIGMGAAVTKDVPPLAIVMGNPGAVVGYRSKKSYEECKAAGRVNTHRILETYGSFNEKLPMMVKRKYTEELEALGMI